MSKRVILMSVVGGALLALVGSSVISSKAHVPLGRAQVCNSNGVVQNVTQKRMQGKLAAGGCRLTACVFNDVDGDDLVQQFIFLPGNDCDATDANGDGFCDATGAPSDIPKRLNAVNVTPACTDPF